MRVAGFDPAIARAHGYLVRRAPNGTQYPVKAGSAVTVSPNKVVSGNCGFSYVCEYGIGNVTSAAAHSHPEAEMGSVDQPTQAR